jgi:hypothetical protein
MRQANDPAFRELLGRARATVLTEENLAFLNSKIPISLVLPNLESITTIGKLNSLYHYINCVQMEHFARSRFQRIYIFPAQHSRTKSTSCFCISVEDLLQQSDKGTRIPCPGLFLYTPDMPAILLTNICILLGQVNDARRVVSGIVVDPTGRQSSAQRKF